MIYGVQMGLFVAWFVMIDGSCSAFAYVDYKRFSLATVRSDHMWKSMDVVYSWPALTLT